MAKPEREGPEEALKLSVRALFVRRRQQNRDAPSQAGARPKNASGKVWRNPATPFTIGKRSITD